MSIVIPTFRRNDLLRRCLEAAAAQDLGPARYEIVVADDAASEETRQVVIEFARGSRCDVRYVAVRNAHGPAAARNRGWRAARGPLIAFTDDDCLPAPQWLREGLAALAPDCGAAWGHLVMPLPAAPTDAERDAAGLASAVFVTANCFVRRGALEAVGGFDARFRLAWREDSDLDFGLLEHGCRVVSAPAAVVVHPIRLARWGSCLAAHRKTAFDALLHTKHPNLYRKHMACFPGLYLAILLSELLAGVLMGLRLQGRAVPETAAWITLSVGWIGTLLLIGRRLRRTSWAPKHVAEMAVTSLLLPWIALFYRLRGAVAHRTSPFF